jgi:polysaccharide export outer membrane protein
MKLSRFVFLLAIALTVGHSEFLYSKNAPTEDFSMSPSAQKSKAGFWDWLKGKKKKSKKSQHDVITEKEIQTTNTFTRTSTDPGPFELDVIPDKPQTKYQKVINSQASPIENIPSQATYRVPQEALLTIEEKKPQSIPSIKTLTPSNKEYRLKPGDKIEISVWGEDMTKELIVRPDGMISYILIDEIVVVGKTFTELKLEIQKRLSKYIIEPKVSIIGKSFEGNFVSILGAVKTPGRKVVSNSDHILDVISKAEGLKFVDIGNTGKVGEIANLRNAYLSRGGRLVKVDFTKLIYEGDMTQNIPIQIGDFIYIPSSIDMPIYITGEFNSPTSLPYTGKPTLLEAVSAGRGFNNDASKKYLKVVRGGLVKPTILDFNYYDIISGQIQNPQLEPGDILYAPPTNLTKIERISTQIIPFLDSIIKTGSSKDTIRDW